MGEKGFEINDTEKLSYNLAIVGGGETCKAFLELLQKESGNYPEIHVAGVCDINPESAGIVMAREMGLYTTVRCSDIVNMDGVDAIVELTNNAALSEILNYRRPGVAVIEHSAGRLLETFFTVGGKLESAKRRINLERRSYDVLFQQSNVGIMALNPDFTVVDANAACLRAVGKTRAEALGKPCHEVVKGFYAPCSLSQTGFECPVAQTLKTGKSSVAIHEYTDAGGRTSYFNIATYPIKDKNGVVVRIIELWREITRQISSRWEDQVRRMETDMKKVIQEDRMISLGRLVASCVHEINNPIQGLLTFSRLMESMVDAGPLTSEDLEEFKKFTGLMSKELERCGEIISGLLSFSRQSSVEYRQVDINDIIHSVISLTRHKMELANIRLHTEFHNEPLYVTGDTNQLQQCVLNLIFNALEAMPGGGELYIVTGKDEEGGPRIEIRDTGCGIREKDLDHIFDPFFTTREDGKGVGLGLSIVYGMVRNHEGAVTVDSREGEGASFVLTFPSS